jgi:hypothetical protein
MRRIVLLLVAVVVILVCVVVSLVVNHDGGSSASALPGPSASATATAGASSPATEPAPTSTASGVYIAPANFVSLPQGSRRLNGLPVGFPHTPQGAVAMAVASATATWTDDAAANSAAARVYSAPGQVDQQAADAAAGAAALRKTFGLPATGPLPAGATLSTWPIGVQWKVLDVDTVQVSFEVRELSSPGTGQPATSRIQATTGLMGWTTSGDWKIIETEPMSVPTPYDLGTDGFNSAGWIAIQQGDH